MRSALRDNISLLLLRGTKIFSSVLDKNFLRGAIIPNKSDITTPPNIAILIRKIRHFTILCNIFFLKAIVLGLYPKRKSPLLWGDFSYIGAKPYRFPCIFGKVRSGAACDLFQIFRIDIARISDIGETAQLCGIDTHRYGVSYCQILVHPGPVKNPMALIGSHCFPQLE